MALGNQVPKKGKQNIAAGDIDFDGHAIKVLLVRTAAWTSFSQATLDAAANVGQITAAAISASRSAALTNKTVTDGICSTADPATFSAVANPTTGSWDALVVYDDTGATDATKLIIAFYDTGVTGLPATPGGADVTLNFPSGVVYTI